MFSRLRISTSCIEMTTCRITVNSTSQYLVWKWGHAKFPGLSCRQLDILTICLKMMTRWLAGNTTWQYLRWKWRLAELDSTRHLNILFQHNDLLSCWQALKKKNCDGSTSTNNRKNYTFRTGRKMQICMVQVRMSTRWSYVFIKGN